ncbi:uncharacterized protein LY89DRAFT_736826 [Mollisia scopiformis]|uniref:Uncharacterized protein n=1 Tax=Mollisia scopiformis TaxID=149040 RepID=A0A194X1H0_MOLSC|nr:uncharacterized protein LY89DRAFT_736826 [Mollisia scopiformis]KUJ13829.1 hypothetical protein LY89DRAFT_736826 [Mollisia scopiformis]
MPQATVSIEAGFGLHQYPRIDPTMGLPETSTNVAKLVSEEASALGGLPIREEDYIMHRRWRITRCCQYSRGKMHFAVSALSTNQQIEHGHLSAYGLYGRTSDMTNQFQTGPEDQS